MPHDPNATGPAPAPASHERGGSEEDEQVRDVDPHPDTPDDFDDDATIARDSIEAVPDDDD